MLISYKKLGGGGGTKRFYLILPIVDLKTLNLAYDDCHLS